MLREVEVLQSQGASISEACRKIGVSEHSYYRWKREYGRLEVDQAKRLKELVAEAAGESRGGGQATFRADTEA